MKCFNCGKEVKDGLKFCTNCGVNFKDKIVYKKEVIYNDKVDGVNIANDKSAIIAIILVMVFCAFVIVMGISAVDKNKHLGNDGYTHIPYYNRYVFNSSSNYYILNDKYTFDSELSEYLDNGFVIMNGSITDSIEADGRRDVMIDMDGLILQIVVHNTSNYPQLLKNCFVSSVNYSNDYNKYSKTTKIYEDGEEDVIPDFVLPNGIKLFYSFDDVRKVYGDYDKEGYKDNSYIYDYYGDEGYIQLVFDNNDQLVEFSIHNEGQY